MNQVSLECLLLYLYIMFFTFCNLEVYIRTLLIHTLRSGCDQNITFTI